MGGRVGSENRKCNKEGSYKWGRREVSQRWSRIGRMDL